MPAETLDQEKQNTKKVRRRKRRCEVNQEETAAFLSRPIPVMENLNNSLKKSYEKGFFDKPRFNHFKELKKIRKDKEKDSMKSVENSQDSDFQLNQDQKNKQKKNKKGEKNDSEEQFTLGNKKKGKTKKIVKATVGQKRKKQLQNRAKDVQSQTSQLKSKQSEENVEKRTDKEGFSSKEGDLVVENHSKGQVKAEESAEPQPQQQEDAESSKKEEEAKSNEAVKNESHQNEKENSCEDIKYEQFGKAPEGSKEDAPPKSRQNEENKRGEKQNLEAKEKILLPPNQSQVQGNNSNQESDSSNSKNINQKEQKKKQSIKQSSDSDSEEEQEEQEKEEEEYQIKTRFGTRNSIRFNSKMINEDQRKLRNRVQKEQNLQAKNSSRSLRDRKKLNYKQIQNKIITRNKNANKNKNKKGKSIEIESQEQKSQPYQESSKNKENQQQIEEQINNSGEQQIIQNPKKLKNLLQTRRRPVRSRPKYHEKSQKKHLTIVSNVVVESVFVRTINPFCTAGPGFHYQNLDLICRHLHSIQHAPCCLYAKQNMTRKKKIVQPQEISDGEQVRPERRRKQAQVKSEEGSSKREKSNSGSDENQQSQNEVIEVYNSKRQRQRRQRQQKKEKEIAQSKAKNQIQTRKMKEVKAEDFSESYEPRVTRGSTLKGSIPKIVDKEISMLRNSGKSGDKREDERRPLTRGGPPASASKKLSERSTRQRDKQKNK